MTAQRLSPFPPPALCSQLGHSLQVASLTHPLGLLTLHTARFPQKPRGPVFRAQFSALCRKQSLAGLTPVNSHPASLSDPDIYLLLKVSSSSCLFTVLTPSVPHGFGQPCHLRLCRMDPDSVVSASLPLSPCVCFSGSAGPLVFKQDLLLPKTDPLQTLPPPVGLCS